MHTLVYRPLHATARGAAAWLNKRMDRMAMMDAWYEYSLNAYKLHKDTQGKADSIRRYLRDQHVRLHWLYRATLESLAEEYADIGMQYLMTLCNPTDDDVIDLTHEGHAPMTVDLDIQYQ